jgi:hypothetical protein
MLSQKPICFCLWLTRPFNRRHHVLKRYSILPSVGTRLQIQSQDFDIVLDYVRRALSLSVVDQFQGREMIQSLSMRCGLPRRIDADMGPISDAAPLSQMGSIWPVCVPEKVFQVE